MKQVVQEHAMGCAVACVASLLNIPYSKALFLFSKKEKAWTRGYTGRDICQALQKSKRNYERRIFVTRYIGKTRLASKINGTIVYVKKNKRYPSGHYLLRTEKGWMNPWINYPNINPIRAGYIKKLPVAPTYIICPTAEN